MSTWREQLRIPTEAESLEDWAVDYYHYPSLAALVVFALWTRIANWERFIRGGDVLLSSNDPYYHLRSTQYVVANWPATMPFDPWTNFAQGTSSAQFGTLFDQLIATAALVVGLGSPSDLQVELVVLFAPVVFGLLAFVPAYYIGRRLGGRFGGVVAVAIVALAPGSLFSLSSVGSTDHHVAEALFQALGVLGLMVALTVAEDEKPVYELLTDRAFGAIRKTLGWSLLAGAAIGAYLLVWPPGVLLLGILGAFFLLHLNLEFVRGRSPEHAAFAGVISLSTAGIIALSTTNTLAISATSRSLLQPGLAFAVAAGCGFMAWFAREWDDRDLSRYGYPVAVFGLVVGLALATMVVLPDLFSYFVNQVLRVIGFTTSPTAGTIAEAQPLSDSGILFNIFKLATVGAVAGALLLLVRQVLDDEPRGQGLLVVVWMAFIVAATFTQVRFLYYFTIPLAVLNAAFVGNAMAYVRGSGDADGVEAYQVMTVVAVLALLIAPMAVAQPTPLSEMENRGPGEVAAWQSSFDWMQDNTPAQGQLGAPDGDPLEYLGSFDRTEDYDYTEGTYGTLAWWDYGHWITTLGHRIPNANPFQQGSNHAARFLLAGNESDALAELEDRGEPDAGTRYVMVDWKMADMMDKGQAPFSFVDNVSRSDFYNFLVDPNRLQQTQNIFQSTLLVRHNQPYYDSMVNRLYNYHGSAMEPQPWVLEWQGSERPMTNGASYFLAPGGNNGTQVIQQFDTLQQARDYVAEAPEVRRLGGVGAYPTERVPALEHFRLVHVGEISGTQGGYQSALAQTAPTQPGWTKTFERVPGATIEGTGPADTTVNARVRLETNVGTTFEYTQRTRTDESGEFSMTVPYATTGYGEYGVEEGYTNTSIRANTSYVLTTPAETEDSVSRWHADRVNVTEGQVLGVDDSPATATLEEQTLDFSGNESESGNATAGGNVTGGNTTSVDNVTDGASGDSGESGPTDTDSSGGNGSGAQGSLVRPAAAPTETPGMLADP